MVKRGYKIGISIGVVALAAAGVATAATDGPATAAITYVCESTGCPPPFLEVEGVAEAERITVRLDSIQDEYLISDSAGLTPEEPACGPVSETLVRCGPIASRFVVDGFGGDDRIAVGGGLTGLAQLEPGPGDDHIAVRDNVRANIYVEGKAGRDVIEGGASGGRDSLTGIHGDLLAGGKGRDVLRAGRGPDEISGGADADEARGGPGRDVLLMAGHPPSGRDIDRIIDCGRGRDIAYVNPKLDPAPIRCERIRTRAGSPARYPAATNGE